MLDDCLPGYSKKSHDHYWSIKYKGLPYPRLPLGGHGRRRHTGRAEIESGHVKHMARFFKIHDCAKKFNPVLA